MFDREPRILPTARLAHDPDAEQPTEYPPCIRCGAQSLASLVDHVCDGCADKYRLCVRCANPEHLMSMYDNPMTREGSCSKCGGAATELWHHTDWWHRDAVDCDGGKTGSFVPLEEASDG